MKNGPYVIEMGEKAKIIIGGQEREVRSKVVALCRCGHSNNKPFCDGSHAKIGFQGEEAEIEID